jgi:hypothetical protein
MGEGRSHVDDGWGSDTDPEEPSSAFDREGPHGRRVTLTLSVPPFALPEDLDHAADVQPAPVPIEPRNYDAWNADRLKRSSLPPTSTLPPAAPVTPLPSRPGQHSGGPGPFGATLPGGPALDEEGDAFALVSRSSSTAPAFDLVAEMAERFALDDFSGSLRAAELLLGRDPDHLLAQHYARETHHKLEVLYRSRLDAQGRVPHLAVAENEVRWLGLDPQVGHLLAKIDGVMDYDQVVKASGMPRLAALRTLVELVDGRVVRLM